MSDAHLAPSSGSAMREEKRPDLIDFLLAADPRGTDALIEAGELYGDDAERELADLAAGRHPAQRAPRP